MASRTDTERLDWLEKRLPERGIGCPIPNRDRKWYIFADEEEFDGEGYTLREAIDKAMEQDDG